MRASTCSSIIPLTEWQPRAGWSISKLQTTQLHMYDKLCMAVANSVAVITDLSKVVIL